MSPLLTALLRRVKSPVVGSPVGRRQPAGHMEMVVLGAGVVALAQADVLGLGPPF